MSLSNEEKNAAYEKLTPQRKQLVDKVMENLEKAISFGRRVGYRRARRNRQLQERNIVESTTFFCRLLQ